MISLFSRSYGLRVLRIAPYQTLTTVATLCRHSSSAVLAPVPRFNCRNTAVRHSVKKNLSYMLDYSTVFFSLLLLRGVLSSLARKHPTKFATLLASVVKFSGAFFSFSDFIAIFKTFEKQKNDFKPF